MKIKIYCNITYIISPIAIHNKPCMHMDGYSNLNSQIKIKCLLNARMQQQHQSQQPPRQ